MKISTPTLCALALSFGLVSCGRQETPETDADVCKARYLAEWTQFYNSFDQDDIKTLMDASDMGERQVTGMLRGRLMAQTLEVLTACDQGRKPRDVFAPR